MCWNFKNQLQHSKIHTHQKLCDCQMTKINLIKGRIDIFLSHWNTMISLQSILHCRRQVVCQDNFLKIRLLDREFLLYGNWMDYWYFHPYWLCTIFNTATLPFRNVIQKQIFLLITYCHLEGYSASPGPHIFKIWFWHR